MRKKVHQFNPLTDQAEIVRDCIVTLACRKNFSLQQNLSITLKHREPSFESHPITPCPEHRNADNRKIDGYQNDNYKT